ncbi:MAG: hypothetical protein P4L46_24875 [Fimbriimonas sp.]|nr:hypothetical protein [Fimbriimonas sp.]
MRIISKFHDFYDSAAGFGLDPERIYRRTPSRVEIETRFWSGSSDVLPYPWIPRYRGLPEPARSVTLGFCGRFYPLWIDSSTAIAPEALTSESGERFWLSQDDALAKLRDLVDAVEYVRGYQERFLARARKIVEHDRRVLESPLDSKLFRDLKCPALVLFGHGGSGFSPMHTVEIIRNPRLTSFGFEKILDPFAAYQAIATFLSNDLVEGDPAPETVGGDEVIARSKGFDDMSFRTMAPGNKKLNRKENRLRKRGTV